MRRETQNVVLVLLGGALVKIVLTQTYTRYVKPAMGPWLLVAGTLIVLLAVAAIVRDIGARGQLPAGLDAHGHEHAHGRSPWLLVLPVLAVFLIAPPALGADSVNRDAAVPPAQARVPFPPLPRAAVLPMTLTDFVTRSGYDSTGSLRGRTVRLTGFVAAGARGTYLARLAITCCAADATPLRVRLAQGAPAGLRDDRWLAVTGIAAGGVAADGVPDLRVLEVRDIAAPADPYEH